LYRSRAADPAAAKWSGGVCATISEAVLIGTLAVLVSWRLLRERVGLVLLVAAISLLSLAYLPHLILLFRLI